MYALAVIRYRKPFEDVEKVLVAHRAYLAGLQAQGLLLASGPLEPRFGGALLLRVPEPGMDQLLERVRDEDPFVKAGVAQYELLPWNPGLGLDGLDRL